MIGVAVPKTVLLPSKERFPASRLYISVIPPIVIGFVVGVIYHVYMSTAAMPGTLRAMTRGTVTRAWAKWHHPRWYREVSGKNE